MTDAIIKIVEYLAAYERRSVNSGVWRFCNRNHERFSDVNEGYDEEPLINLEVVHPDIPAELPGVELYSEQTMSEIQESDTNNPAAVESSASRALSNYGITLSYPN